MLQSGCYKADVTKRMLQSGCYKVDVTSRMLQSVCYNADVTKWMLQSGCYRRDATDTGAPAPAWPPLPVMRAWKLVEPAISVPAPPTPPATVSLPGEQTVDQSRPRRLRSTAKGARATASNESSAAPLQTPS
eukprot:6542928-Pyramimonas_sp.AAC.1